MLLSETAQILAKVQLLDNRTVDRITLDAGHEIIGHLDYADAMAALNLHRRESTEYIMPAHIIQNLRRAKLIRQTAEAKQRAIEATQARQILAERGEDVTPIRLQEIQATLKDFGKMPDRPRLEIVKDKTA
jgi:hypothetical protein